MSNCKLCGADFSKGRYLFMNGAIIEVCPECAQSNDGYIINEIRFLPMSKDVFEYYEDVQVFINEILPDRGNTYHYQTNKMNCSPNTFVLFQYGGRLVAYAIYLETIVFDHPIKLGDGELYKGYYQFAPDSIFLLDEPITAEEFAVIDPSFNGFNQSMQKKSAELLPDIFNIISSKSGNINVLNNYNDYDSYICLPEEIDEEEVINLKEGCKKQITVNAYERNPKARKICINHYRKKNNGRVKCEICGFDFGKIYGEEFIDKINIHHLRELSSIGEEYEVDAVNDLIPICPNCHLVAHSRKPAYTPDEIKNMLRQNESMENEINI